MEQALAGAGLAPAAIDYINLHGTGTRSNDAAEGRAVLALFGNATRCSSTKGAIGHTLGAAGGVEAVIQRAGVARMASCRRASTRRSSIRAATRVPAAQRGASAVARAQQFVRLWRHQLQPRLGSRGSRSGGHDAGLAAYIDGIGLIGPGLPNWPAGEAVLCGQCRYVAQPARAAGAGDAAAGRTAARRRASSSWRWPSAMRPPSRRGRIRRALPTVFAASGADGEICHEICQMLARSDRQISPTRFHNSVHNAPAGYWSIATRRDGAVDVAVRIRWQLRRGTARGLCQVLVDRDPVLLIAYDTGYPEPLHRVRPIADAFGMALVLSPERVGADARSRSTWSLRPRRRRRHGRSGARIAAHRLSCGARAAAAARACPRADAPQRARLSRSPPSRRDVDTMRARPRLDRGRIPHRHRMCLLDGVVHGTRHVSSAARPVIAIADNPLRAHGRLGAACGIEYAAQAMAVHGALLAAEASAAADGLSGQPARRDAPRVEARRRRGGSRSRGAAALRRRQHVIYRFAVRAGQRELLSGRAAVVLDAGQVRSRGGRHGMRRALVTGGSGGIGAAICRRLAADGCHVSSMPTPTATRRSAWSRRSPPPAARPRPSRSMSPTRRRRKAALEAVLARRRRSRSSSTMPASTTMPCSRDARRAMASRHRRVAERILQRHAAADDADDPHALGAHHQHILGRRACRQSRPGELRGGQGRAQCGDHVAGDRTRQPRHHRQRGRAGHHRHGDERRRFDGRDHRAHGADEARRHSRTRSPISSPSSHPTARPTSPGRSSRSTAG